MAAGYVGTRRPELNWLPARKLSSAFKRSAFNRERRSALYDYWYSFVERHYDQVVAPRKLLLIVKHRV